MGSLCESCFAPGQCCKRLHLYRKGEEITYWADEGLAGVLREMEDDGLPFTPRNPKQFFTVDKLGDENHGRRYMTVEYNCPWLLPNGRCGSYENRPDVCRVFEPGSEPLCVHWRGAEGSESIPF